MPTDEGRAPGDPDAAVEAARRALYRPGAGAEAVADLRRAEQAARPSTVSTAPVAPAPAPALVPRRRLRPVLIAVIAVLAAGAIGWSVARLQPAPSAPALAVLDRPQRSTDHPADTAPLPPVLVARSIRRLGASTTTGTDVFAARDRAGRVCLLAVVVATRAVAACSSDRAFAVDGLRLDVLAAVDPETADDLSPRGLSIHWSRGGGLTF